MPGVSVNIVQRGNNRDVHLFGSNQKEQKQGQVLQSHIRILDVEYGKAFGIGGYGLLNR